MLEYRFLSTDETTGNLSSSSVWLFRKMDGSRGGEGGRGEGTIKRTGEETTPRGSTRGHFYIFTGGGGGGGGDLKREMCRRFKGAILRQTDGRTDGRERKGKGKVKVRRKIYSSRNLIGRVIYRVGPKTSFPSRSFYRVHPNIKRFLSFFKGVIK